MTNLDTLKNCFDEMGVRYTESDRHIMAGTYAERFIITPEDPVRGYGSFYCEFVFTDTGKLDHIGVWE